MSIFKRLKAKIKNALNFELATRIDSLIMLQSELLARDNMTKYLIGGGHINAQEMSLESMEFKAFSQNGEDGILDFLIEILKLDTPHSPYPRAFIEFGVQNYTESNTRYLLKKRNWQGLVLDGGAQHIHFIRNDEIYYKHDLEAQCAFITRENINTLISTYLQSRKLHNVALLSIDIDGMDYHIWRAIKCITPAVVVIEFNAIFGDRSVSVPYRADFDRFKAHFSGLYFGASITALIHLGNKKGYTFIGADSSGTNLFFIRNELESRLHLKIYPPLHYCNTHQARQSRDEQGRLNYINGAHRFELIKHLPLETIP